MLSRSLSLLFLAFLISCSSAPWEKISDGVVVHVRKDGKPDHSVRLQVLTDQIIRVSSVPGKHFADKPSLMIIDQLPAVPDYTVEEEEDAIILKTAYLRARVLKATGEVIFTDADGNMILAEKQGGGKSFETVSIEGEDFISIRQQFESPDDEALYGLGSNQTGFLNMKGKDFDMYQYNTQAVVPFLISSRNYGILWDNYSRTKFGDPRERQEISSLKLFDASGNEGGLTAVYTNKNNPADVFLTQTENEISYNFLPDQEKFPEGFDLQNGLVTWEGFIASDTEGLHKFTFTSAGYAKLWIDGKQLFDRWRMAWNLSNNQFDLAMEAGKQYPFKIEWIPDGGESYIALKHLDPLPVEEQNRISLYSEVADQLDYYFIAGGSMDEVISGYRTLTGKAPIVPRWAMGFWQSRERYTTQEELLNVVREFRKRNIPFDNIVLDWQYWPIDSWGDHEFEASRFPDPEEMVRTLHEELDARIMISVWPKYYKGTSNYEHMKQNGWLYMLNIEKDREDWLGFVSTFYDAFNPGAQKAFWEQLDTSIYRKGIDAWWLDATEPDIHSNLPMDERKALMNPTYLGPGAKYFNAYSLEQAKGVYEGQRGVNPDQRVFILTRSAFAGLQRYAAANWSGDVATRWHDMLAQIPAGLNMSVAGIPYWTMDIGGFSVERRYENATGEDLVEWRELMTRWHQYGAFVPIFRSHGQYPHREFFNTAPEGHPAYQSMLAYNKLRYRLMPYIYSLAGNTWLHDYTIMRPLAMDFGSDAKVHDIIDQYMFGPGLLINPVYEYKARSRQVYLPEGTAWYNLHTGQHFNGGQNVDAPAPYEYSPIFIKAGSVMPVGPEIQHSGQGQTAPVTLMVFAGQDGSFELYEDEGLNYNYEKGAYATIPFSFSQEDKTLTIGERQGKYNGMLAERTFHIIVVTPDNPRKLNFDGKPDVSITYDGSSQTVDLSAF